MQNNLGWKNYIIAFVITLGIFVTIIFISRAITNQKIVSLRETQDSIATDILSSETEFSLLSELSCKNIGANTLTQELNSMADKITYGESNIGQNEDLLRLKKYYFLLEIKDFLLMKKINQRCGTKITPILYIYTPDKDCSDCAKQGYVLTALREKYPDLRVYSFDYNADLSALHALMTIYKVDNTKLPTIIVNEETYTGFHSLEEIEALIPNVVKAQQTKEKAAAKAAADSSN